MTLHHKFTKVSLVGFQNVFSKEFRTLLLLLMVFSTSYLIRFLCDVVPLKVFPDDFMLDVPPCPHEKPAQDIVALIMLNLCDGYVFDFIPIGSVLLFHYRNFRVKNSDAETDTAISNNRIQTPK